MGDTPPEAASSNCYHQLKDLLQVDREGDGTSFKENTAAGFIVGAGRAAREAVPALHKLGLSPIFILHYDSGEMYNLLNDFLHINLQGLRTPGMAQRELDDLAEKGIQVVLGVATIPSTPPASPREEYVFNIAKLLLEQPYKSEGSQDEHLRLPNRRPLADMLNSKDALFMQKEAEGNGWQVSAIEADTSDSTLADAEADNNSPYWWQFKQKVAVA